MSSPGSNQPTNETSLLHIDSTTLHAIVTIAVSAIMAYINASNASKNGNGVDNSNLCNNQGNQQVPTRKNTPTHKPRNRKQKSWNRKGNSFNQGPPKRQQIVTVRIVTIPTTPTPLRSYNGNQPKCNRCNCHHHGPCRERYCARCNRKGHTVRSYRGPIQPPAITTNVGVGRTCYKCGATGHIRRDCPKANNRNAGKRGRVFAMGQEEAVADPTDITGMFPSITPMHAFWLLVERR